MLAFRDTHSALVVQCAARPSCSLSYALSISCGAVLDSTKSLVSAQIIRITIFNAVSDHRTLNRRHCKCLFLALARRPKTTNYCFALFRPNNLNQNNIHAAHRMNIYSSRRSHYDERACCLFFKERKTNNYAMPHIGSSNDSIWLSRTNDQLLPLSVPWNPDILMSSFSLYFFFAPNRNMVQRRCLAPSAQATVSVRSIAHTKTNSFSCSIDRTYCNQFVCALEQIHLARRVLQTKCTCCLFMTYWTAGSHCSPVRSSQVAPSTEFLLLIVFRTAFLDSFSLRKGHCLTFREQFDVCHILEHPYALSQMCLPVLSLAPLAHQSRTISVHE